MGIDEKYKKEDLERLIFIENKSYREIGRIYSVSDTYIKKIANKKPICIEEGVDQYKRILAECFIEEESLSSFLVRNGYAFAYRRYSDKFIKDENFAKENRNGMWSMIFDYPWDFRRK